MVKILLRPTRQYLRKCKGSRGELRPDKQEERENEQNKRSFGRDSRHFLFIIMGATDGRAPAGFAPIAIGLTLALIHLISIPVTNTSVNPARSTGPAIVVGGMALQQLWLFWVAPILGALVGGFVYKSLNSNNAQ